MSKNTTIVSLGILLAVMPFLGFPTGAKDVLFVFLGLAIAIIGYFSNVRYCNNCNQLIENGKHGILKTDGERLHGAGNKQHTVGDEVSNLHTQPRKTNIPSST